MTYSFSVISAAQSAPRVAVPPPLPAADKSRSSHLFDETDEDMRRLTADISRVLARQPDLRVVGAQNAGGEFSPSGAFLIADDETAHPFEWQVSETPRAQATADHAAGWLSRARRERRYARLRSALSWCVALGIAGVIVVAVAGTVRGGPALIGVLDDVRRMFGV
jgi:hypothetical protein